MYVTEQLIDESLMGELQKCNLTSLYNVLHYEGITYETIWKLDDDDIRNIGFERVADRIKFKEAKRRLMQIQKGIIL